MKVSSQYLGLALAIACLGILTEEAAANPAPLDTLMEYGAESEDLDPRYSGAEFDTSRKRLPEAQATTIEKSRSPKMPPRLDDPMAGAYSFHLARQAALSDNPDGVKENLEAAIAASPGHPRYQWWQTVQALKSMDTATLFRVLPTSVRALMNSPVGRGHFIVAWHQGATLLNGFFWTVLVSGLYLAWWRKMAHDMGATILKDPKHQPRFLLPLLMPVILVLFKPGWFGFLAIMSIPLLVHARGKVRILILATWIMALALVFPGWPVLRSAVPTVDPTSEVTLLDRACTLPPSGGIIRELKSRIATSEDQDRTNRLTVALAIQEARRGSYQESTHLFRKVLETEPTNYPAMVGVANNTYYRGRMDNAAKGYSEIALAHPDRGEASYNLAQVYFKKLFVPEATEAMEKARSLGFIPAFSPKSANRRKGYAPVVYPPLTNQAMNEACNFEAPNYPPLVILSSWRHQLGSPPLPLYILVGAPLLLALFLIMWWNKQNDPTECENCGIPLCHDCCKVHDGAWLCAGCGETAERSRSDMVLGTLLKNRSREQGMALGHRVIKVGRLLPGAGHLATGQFRAAFIRLSILAAGLFLLFAGWAFDMGSDWSSPGLMLPGETLHPKWLPMPAAMWPGWSGSSVLLGAGLIALSWIIALFDGPGLRRGTPDRYSLTPNTATRETITGAGIATR
jgi:tetratricopeptide (TPR) repeat protein